jgi:hypothetical protein
VPRPNWQHPLPQTLIIPGVMKLKTLADVRTLIGHVPKERRALDTWRHVEKCLNAAATGGDIKDATIALRLVLTLEGVPCRPSS